jgi:hypothetical protein
MKQYKVTSYDINQDSPDDCYLDPLDPIHELKVLSGLGGLGGQVRLQEYNAQHVSYGETFGQSGSEKAELMRKNNIKPGDIEWFKLWFSLPYMIDKK